MRFQLVARRVILAPVLGLALAAAVVACSSSGSPSTPSPGSSPPATSAPASSASSNGAAAAAQITANWEKFFSSSTPTSQRVALLQNGTAFATAISSLTHR